MSSTLWLLKFERSHPFPPPDLAEQAADLCLGILRKTCGATVTVTTDGFAYEQADNVERIFFAVIGLLLLPLTFLLTGLGGHVLGCSDSYRACSQAVFPPVQPKPCPQTPSNLSASMPAQLSPTSPVKKKDLTVEAIREAIKNAIANDPRIKQIRRRIEQLRTEAHLLRTERLQLIAQLRMAHPELFAHSPDHAKGG